jgi:hypothetical protein
VNFPGRHRELNTLFVNATDPDLSHLKGEYLVNILMVPGYRTLRHRKRFYTENGNVLGYNLILHKIWGRFIVEEGLAAGAVQLNGAVINYNRPENLFFIRRIRDYIRCVKKDKLYIGRAGYRLFRRTIFLGYFTREKIEK